MRFRRDLVWLVLLVAALALGSRMLSSPQVNSDPPPPVPLAFAPLPTEGWYASPPNGISGRLKRIESGSSVDLKVPYDFGPLTWLKPERGRDREWEISISPDGASFILLGGPHVYEWDQIMAALKDDLPDLAFRDKGVVRKEAQGTRSRLVVRYRHGTATIFQKPRAVAIAGYSMWERIFTVIVAGDPADPHFYAKTDRIILSLRDLTFDVQFGPSP